MNLTTIFAALKAAIPTVVADTQVVVNVANELKTAAVAAGTWTTEHEAEFTALVPTAAAASAPIANTPETA